MHKSENCLGWNWRLTTCHAGSSGRTGHRRRWGRLGTCPPPPVGVLEVIQPLVRGVTLTPQEPLQQLLSARLVPHHLRWKQNYQLLFNSGCNTLFDWLKIVYFCINYVNTVRIRQEWFQKLPNVFKYTQINF